MQVKLESTLPLNDEYQVIVVGGGPGGCAAAVAAARGGMRTLLIESTAMLGGMGTLGLVPAWCPFTDHERIIYAGIAQEVFEATKAEMPHIKPSDVDWVAIDVEVLKRVYDRLVSAAGVDVLFQTVVGGIHMEGERIDYVIAANKRGLTAYRAPVFIDCTGDADLVAFAGLPFEYGDDIGHEVQPSTHCFTLTNVDEYAYATGPRMHMSRKDCPIYDIVNDPQFPLVLDGHSCNSLVGPRTVGFNAGHIWNVDATDPIGLSRATMQGRELAHQLHEGLKKHFPSAFAASFLASTASVLGTRESRRIIGDYRLTLDDYVARRNFPDEVARNAYFIDVHIPLEIREQVNAGEVSEEAGFDRYGPGESHGVPYGCMLPKGLDNVLVAGRTISCDHDVQGSVRVMPLVLVMGQVVGTAAAMTVGAGGDVPRALDVQALRAKLREDGAYLP